MKAQEIRQKYFKYFSERDHQVIPRALLVPQDDPTTLFTGSGMQPLIQYLLGAKHPEGNRLADSQTCLRAEDIDEVGDNRHTTFFEMLGNWSLGDYFKAEQLPWFFEFLVDEVGIDPNKLYVTCFSGDDKNGVPKDEESAEIWQKLFKDKKIDAKIAEIGSEADGYKRGMKADERIFYYDASKNWWSRSGTPDKMPEGEPGGPDSEVFYLFDSVEHDKSYGEHCHPNCDCGRFLEIGNSVFMEYQKTTDGFSKLPQKNVDFGGGLERIAAASIDEPDVFKISLLWPIIEKLSDISKKSYDDHIIAKRVIADHMRAAVWLAVDGVIPSNKEQGYVMRRLIRRSVLKAHELGIESDFTSRITPVVIEIYRQDFAEIARDEQKIIEILEKEERIFRQTLRKGIRVFKNEVETELSGENIFKLYDTYGFPVELSLEQAKEQGIKLSENWQGEFDALMKQQRERSRTATKGQFKGGLGGSDKIHRKYHTATHLLYKALKLVLGEHVLQRGSNITDERLRFDFEHPEKMTDKELKKVEDIVNQQIERGLDVSFKEIPTKEAMDKGALGAFGDTYGDTVKVYTMSKDGEPLSFEICGGPHVENTAELAENNQKFVITKEQSSSAGIRRIKAVLR